MHRTLLLLIPLLVAGCMSGDDTPVESAQVADAASAQDASAAAVAPDATNATANARPPVPIPVSYAGRTPQGACVPVGCNFEGGSEDFHLVEVVGQPTLLGLTITFGEQVPGHEFYVGVCGGADEAADCGDYTTGSSPLSVEFDVSSFARDSPVGISVGSLNGAAGAAGVMTFAPVDFEVEGVLFAT